MFDFLMAGALALVGPRFGPVGIPPVAPQAHVLYAFSGKDEMALGGITAGPNGVLYGASMTGGSANCNNGCGYIFSLTPAGRGSYKEQTLYQFTGGTQDGWYPVGAPIVDTSGNVYGTTANGGNGSGSQCSNGGCGTVYRLVPSGAGYKETVIHDFEGGVDGRVPYARLTEDRSGVLYGTTRFGGNGASFPDNGIAFKLTPQGDGYNETIMYTFGSTSKDPDAPVSPLTLNPDGSLYGTSECAAGCNSNGSVYKLKPAGRGYSLSILYSFTNPWNGVEPVSVVADGHGNLLGAALQGGEEYLRERSRGVLFELNPGRNGYRYSAIHRFTKDEGNNPFSPLVPDGSGAFYGTCASASNTFKRSTVFKLTPAGSGYDYETVYVVPFGIGSSVQGNFVVNSAGHLFISAPFGGPKGVGDVFELMP